MSNIERWWIVTDPEDGHAYAVENTEADADAEAATLGGVEVVEVVRADANRGAVAETEWLRARAEASEADYRAARRHVERLEAEHREFVEGLTGALDAHGVPAMPSWRAAIDWLAAHGGQRP